jgi:hypothetical protein
VMKPVNILLLVLAGAIGGAVVMKVAQRHHAAVHAPAAAQVAMAPPELPAHIDTPGIAANPEPVAKAEPPAAIPEFQAPAHHVRSVAKPVPAKPVAAKPQTMKRAWTTPVAPAAPSQPPEFAQNHPVARVEPPAAVPMKPEPAKAFPPVRQEPENATPVSPAPYPIPPEPNRVTLNTGMLIPVRLVDSLSSERNQAGDRFAASLDRELVVDGFVIAERGARVEGRVTLLDRGSKLGGGAELTVEVNRIHLSDGQVVTIQTDGFDKRSEQTHAEGAEKIGAGTAIGAIIGAIAGGGKGAAIGAGAGAGVGVGGAVATRRPATLPSETRISFRLRASVIVTEKTN